MTSAVEIAGLEFSYPRRPPLFTGLDLEVAAGERVAVVGPNGAGKSTLLLLLNGVLRPKRAATLSIFGRDPRVDTAAVRADVGLVFQSPDDQLFCPTLYEDVAFGPRNLGLPEDEVRLRCDKALADVGLAAEAPRSALELSFGQRKRAAVATVLAMGCRLLALDEPTSNLDPKSRRELRELLSSLDSAQLIVTHDLAFARETCPRCLVLEGGKVIANGPTGEVLGDEAWLRAHDLA